MADLFGLASSYVPAVPTPAQALNTLSSSPTGSPAAVPGLTTPQKAQAATIAPTALAETNTTVLTEAYAKAPVVTAATNTPADFYRRGKISSPSSATLSQDVQDSNVFSVNNQGVSYDILPRLLDDTLTGTQASIRMLGKATGNSTGPDIDLIPPYTKFFLENVQEAHTERSQIVETFGDFYVFFFGERPPIYTFTGTLLNSKSINWAADWMFFYDQFLRGTSCVNLNARLVLTYDYRQIDGFILSTSTSTVAATDKGIQMTFQVLVIDRKILNLSIDFGIIEANGKFNNDQPFLNLLVNGLSNANVSAALNQVQAVTNGQIAASFTNPIPSSNADVAAAKFGVSANSNSSGGVALNS